MTLMRACVIGAGAAGLCTARHISALSNWEPVIYERSNKVGGVWVYEGKADDKNNKNSMYKNLRTNLPKQVMAYPDFPFPKSLPSFIDHTDVQNYLAAYADRFDLLQYIKFNHEVVAVEKTVESDVERWSVKVKNMNTNEVFEELFDAIFICTGHYHKPNLPDVPNAGNFRGLQMHSQDYRVHEQFVNMNVACFGAGASGVDIALDLCTSAKKVYLCHKGPPMQCPLPPNLHQLESATLKFTENGIIKGDQSNAEEVPMDAVIYCTGYKYEFRFLQPNTKVIVDGWRVSPLYQHLVNIEEPSMFFIGLCRIIFPFPFFDTQAQFAATVLSGKTKLPSKEEMFIWENDDYKRRKDVLALPHKRSHFMGPMQWDYLENLAKMGRFELRVLPVIQKLYEHIKAYRNTDLLGYHSVNYEVIDKDKFVVLN